MGRAAFVLRPVHARPLERLKQSTRLFADKTTAPVLDPGRGCTNKGQLWAYARIKPVPVVASMGSTSAVHSFVRSAESLTK